MFGQPSFTDIVESHRMERELERKIDERIRRALAATEKGTEMQRGVARKVGPITGPDGIALTISHLAGSEYRNPYDAETFCIGRVVSFQVVNDGHDDWVVALVEAEQPA